MTTITKPQKEALQKRYGQMKNLAMFDKLVNGECISVLSKGDPDKSHPGHYIISRMTAQDIYRGNFDYCNPTTEQWIWSIGVEKETGRVIASIEADFYCNDSYDCIWLR